MAGALNLPRSAIQEWQLDASRFAVLSRLSDDLAHEIKNPLHAMVINLEVLKRRIENGASDAALERAAMLEHELHRVHGLVDGLLRLLRPSGEREGPTSVSLIITEIQPLIELRARLARIEFSAAGLAVDAYTRVRPDVLRFGLIMVAEHVLERACQTKGSMRFAASLQPEEIHFRIGCAESALLDPATVLREDPGTLRGVPAAAALLEPVGGAVEIQNGMSTGHGIQVLMRVPRTQFI